MKRKIRTLALLAAGMISGLLFFLPKAGACGCEFAPGIVTGLIATPLSDSTVTLSWDEPDDSGFPILDYSIEYRTYGSDEWSAVEHDPIDATSIEVAGLEGDTIYEFHVAASNENGSGGFGSSLAFATDLTETYADAAFTEEDNSGERFLGVNMFTVVQRAIDAVDDGGVVHIAAGTYSERLRLSRSVGLSGETSGGPEAPLTHLVVPDCHILLTVEGGESEIESIDFDGNDSGHVCAQPMITVGDNALLFAYGAIFRNANVAIKAAADTGVELFFTEFSNVATAIRSDSADNLIRAIYSYWGGDAGPYQAETNPSGNGAAIDGAGGSVAYFRPFIPISIFTGGFGDVSFSSVSPAGVQGLFANGGTFVPFGTDGPFDRPPLDAVSGINVTEDVVVTVPADSGSSVVHISGEPSFFGPGFIFAEHSENLFDASALSAGSLAAESASNVYSGASVAAPILQWGIPGTRLDIEYGDDAEISLYVGDSYNGHTLSVLRSDALDSGWTQVGLLDPLCLVSEGLCEFATRTFGYFAAVSIPDDLAVVYANSATGDDSTGDGSAEAPYQTFAKAYSEAIAGGTINLTGTFDWSDDAETGDASGTGFVIDKTITIRGQGAANTFIQAASAHSIASRSVFTIPAGKRVTLDGVTVRYGVSGSALTGAGITNRGILNIYNSRVTDNEMDLGGFYESEGAAAGVYTYSGSSLTVSTSTIGYNTFIGALYGAGGIFSLGATLRINASTIAGNTGVSSMPGAYPYNYADVAGGMRITGGTASIINSTIFGNSTNSYGGAINIYHDEGVSITSTTIVGNHAELGAAGILYAAPGDYRLKIKNTILADNATNSGGEDFYALDNEDMTSSDNVEDNGYNIVEFSVGKIWSAEGDVTGDQEGLNIDDRLRDNDAENGVKTLALLSGSFAIDTGSLIDNEGIAIPEIDQRGLYRNGARDIGAFEYGALHSPVPDDVPGTTAISFQDPTPAHNSTLVSSEISVALSAGADGHGYAFLDFNHSLAGWWRFENSAADSAGGTLSSAWNGTEDYASGRFGTAAHFDGETSVDAVLDHPIESSFTVSAWVRLDELTVGAAILSDDDGHLIQIGGSNRWQFGNAYSEDSTARAGEWTHVAGTYDSLSNTETLYVNGQEIISGLNTRALGPEIYIGKRNDDMYIHGSIDEAMIFDRALGADEIAALYDGVANQYIHAFSDLGLGDYVAKGYVADAAGTVLSTEERRITLAEELLPTHDAGTGGTQPPPSRSSHPLSASLSPVRLPLISIPAAVQPAAASKFALVRNLDLRSTGKDVASLQQFLILQNRGRAAKKLAAAGATGYFGLLTQSALAEYQAAMRIVPSIGYFGPKTRSYIGAH